MASEVHPPEDAAPGRDEAGRESAESGEDTLQQILAAISGQVAEIRDQLDRLLNVQFDRLRLRLRSGMFRLLSSLLFGAVCVVAVAAATLYLLEGVAGLFAALFGGLEWAGNLAAGGIVLLVVMLAIVVFARGNRKRELRRLKRKYEPGPTKGESR